MTIFWWYRRNAGILRLAQNDEQEKKDKGKDNGKSRLFA
jgi:hypothetical protein